MTAPSCDTAQIMTAIGELRGQNAEIPCHQTWIESRLDRIEGTLVPSAEMKAIERRVGRVCFGPAETGY